MASERRSSIKLCVLNWFSKKITMLRLQKAYGDQAMKKTAMYKWYAPFLGGQQGIHGDKRSGRPNVMSNHVAVIKELLDNDRRITVREIHERSDCSINNGSYFNSFMSWINHCKVCFLFREGLGACFGWLSYMRWEWRRYDVGPVSQRLP
jgi:hypothetical protein